jgi:hypothetical protein
MATDEGQQAVDGVSRRSLLRGGLLAGAGLATLGAASGVLTGTAKAATTNPQPSWAFCRYCSVMWWEPGSHAACTGSGSDGHHGVANGSYEYAIMFNQAGATTKSDPQSGWTWCSLCEGLFWGKANSFCAGNLPGLSDVYGPHTVGSTTNYALYSGYASADGLQSDWRWCTQCHLLFWSGGNANGGACPAYDNNGSGYDYNSEHTGGGTNYDSLYAGTWVVS